MFLEDGTYIKASDICYLSRVRKEPGQRRWNATMTHEIVDPDTFYIDLKLYTHAIRLEYQEQRKAAEVYGLIRREIGMGSPGPQ
jgi:hypothetical protein